MKNRSSVEETISRFGTPEAASKYSMALDGTSTHRREMSCILSALEGLPSGASVLDIPCGTGRLLKELTEHGYKVTEADSSPHMIKLAQSRALKEKIDLPEEAFIVADILKTNFQDKAFDAVVSNRLFHHFPEPEVRRCALKELGRIARGRIIVSFFSTRSVDAIIFRMRRLLKHNPAMDRIPISPKVFELDVQTAGFRVSRFIAKRPGISMQCYAVIERPNGSS
jgi:ubiquinone/menaquinone biosynthesis C-methylase UbiE